ncbi:MAG: class I SAM-dependent methyltransferase [Anaerolineales bacterium]
MKPTRDPERAELNHLVAACPLHNLVVLEIGCGDGTFTRQYGRMAHSVMGIDPAMSDLVTAKKKAKSMKSNFIQGEGEGLPFPSQFFNIALFASSL